jgi:DNA-3-methyladenine glycosylase
MSRRVSSPWFNRDTTIVARELLGKILCRRLPTGKVIKLPIVETEAYLGTSDTACHSFDGCRTDRTEVMYAAPATIYVYLVYGLHWMLNIVTEAAETPTAVLIRGAGKYNGPGKLTRALQIDQNLNNKKLGIKNGLWIEEGKSNCFKKITVTPRIGIHYAAEPWLSAPLRFLLNT